MAYALDRGLFLENGPAIQAADANAARRPLRSRSWRMLDPERKLEAIERAMKAPANDLIDRYPIAL